jgi:sec-independent protein translocase protein TatA
MALPSIGPLELIIILAIALLIVGPKRLPEMGNAFGRTIREFRKATTDVAESTSLQADSKPAPVSAAPAAAAPPAPAVEPTSAAGDAPEPESGTNDDAARPA